MNIHIKIHVIVIIAFLMCSSNTGISQGIKKNAIYVSLGAFSFSGNYTNYTATYERMINPRILNKNISSFIKVGFGGTALTGGTHFLGGRVKPENGKYVYTQLGILIGANHIKLEMGLGTTRYVSGYWESDGFLPALNMGWRYQDPGGNFIFRLGASFPELVYASVGFYF